MRKAIESEDPAPGAAPVEQLIGLDLRTVLLADVVDIQVVILGVEDVPGSALPAAVADHQARRIQCLRQGVESFHRMPLLACGGQFGHAPTVVEVHPDDEAGVAVVAIDGSVHSRTVRLIAVRVKR